MAANALNRHLALAGFMGAGKTTLGEEVARRLRRRFVDLDHEIERQAGATIEELFARDGEAGVQGDRGGGRRIRARRRRARGDRPRRRRRAVGRDARDACGGARSRCCSRSTRASPGSGRARAGGRSRSTSRRSTRSTARASRSTRRPPTRTRATPTGSCSPLPASTSGIGALELLDELVPGDGPVEIVADANVAGIHGVTAQLALGDRDIASHDVPPGEAAKAIAVLERLWRALRIGRDGTIVGLGGGCTTDLAGFAAATYMRGVPWVAVPTTLVGQVDAAIGGKTAVDLPGGKNLVGAFHWPARVVIDPGHARDAARGGDAERDGGGREDGPADGRARSGSCRSPSSCAAARRSRPRSASPTRTTAGRATSSTSATRSGTRSRPRPATTSRTGRRSRSGWSRRSGSRATTRRSPPSGASSTRNRSGSTARPPGRPSPATRSPSAACRGSSCSSATGEPTWGNEVPAADVRAALDSLIAD